MYLLARQGIKPDRGHLERRAGTDEPLPQAWPTDLAAAYLASTYRLMQRNDDADRIVKQVPWSATEEGLR